MNHGSKLYPLALLPAALACASGTSIQKNARQPELIPRQVLFGNPAKTKARLSPDGKRVAFLAPLHGALNLHVAPVDQPDSAQALTADKTRGIRKFAWAHTGKHLLYVQDRLGDENHRLYVVDVETTEERVLTSAQKTQARIAGLSPRHPESVLVALNDRDPRVHDLYKINIKTSKRELVLKNPGFFAFLPDRDLRPALAFAPTKEGGYRLMKRDGEKWSNLLTFAMEDATGGTFELGPEGAWLYFADPRGRNTAALNRIELATGKLEVLASDDEADIHEILMDPISGKVQAAASTYLKKRWHILDKSLQKDFERLRTLSPGDFEILGRTKQDTLWLLAFDADTHPLRYYLYDRTTKQGRLLFSTHPKMEKYPLARMRPIVITARDGMRMVCYLTLPPTETNQKPSRPLPTVIYPHGGPWDRDVWGYSKKDQWLANRGYAVLRVNFRGSNGFGKKFINAANKEWAGAMHNDVLDVVQWAQSQGISDPARTMIMGGSYGGYETLVGLSFSPEVFACGVARVAWADLVDYLSKTASYNQAFMDLVAARVGDPRTEEGRRFLRSRSPISKAQAITKPLLIAQGAQDPRSKPEEAEKLIAAMPSNAPVTYLLYEDEGHAFSRAASRISFNALTELFLKTCLGGRAEPLGKDLEGANFKVVHGEEYLPSGIPLNRAGASSQSR